MDGHEDDFEAAKTPPILKIAGGVGMFAGVIILLTGIQTLSGFVLLGLYAVAPYFLLLIGAGLAFAGSMLLRARSSGAILQLTLSILGLVISGIWLLLSLYGGLLSLFGLSGPVLSAMSLGLSVIALKPCDQVNTARKRLAEKGLELGV